MPSIGAADSARQLLFAAVRRPGHGWTSTIAGTSMAPTIADGAQIRVVPCPADGYRAGMVVACLTATDTLFAHRIVRCVRRRDGRHYVLTVGDGWILCDPPTAVGDIVGVVAGYRDAADWTAPAAAPARRGWNRRVSHASMRLVLVSLHLHPVIARHVAGCCLHAGAWLKSLRQRIGRR